ncbi:helix-turn-helix transcriptional regulator [Pseudogemmobacter bohemicus]|uniref:helix-turn-helix transcriptional regulator n=1 Tax=Pseudogemmobacter bohemicus TaxID=2250708 RepID=UPI0018E5891E|nr:hypothetical protein [Pseudogemmobacter bohemicus]
MQPHITPPGSLRREDAARYCGCSPAHFDKLVREGIMPEARNLGGVKVWLREELEQAMYALPVFGRAPGDAGGGNSCDAAFGL